MESRINGPWNLLMCNLCFKSWFSDIIVLVFLDYIKIALVRSPSGPDFISILSRALGWCIPVKVGSPDVVILYIKNQEWLFLELCLPGFCWPWWTTERGIIRIKLVFYRIMGSTASVFCAVVLEHANMGHFVWFCVYFEWELVSGKFVLVHNARD